MSLINEALKKAQRQTHPESPVSSRPLGSTGLPYSAPSAPPVKPPAPPVALIVAGAGVLISVSVLATVWLLRAPTPAVKEAKPAGVRHEVPPAASTVVIATAPDTAPTAPPLAPRPALSAAADTPPPAPAPAPTVAAAAAPTLVPLPTQPTPASPAKVVAKVAPVSPPPAVIDDVEASAAAAQKLIDEMRISGVRQQGAGSKVLINGRVYRLNEIVDRTLGLRLTQVHPTQLTFTDRQGAIFTREF